MSKKENKNCINLSFTIKNWYIQTVVVQISFYLFMKTVKHYKTINFTRQKIKIFTFKE